MKQSVPAIIDSRAVKTGFTTLCHFSGIKPTNMSESYNDGESNLQWRFMGD